MWLFKATIFGVVAIVSGYGDSRCFPGLCQQLCFDTIVGYQCGCTTGFKVNPANSRTCIPINGCPVNKCEQLCISENGSFRCGCRNGYYINPQDGISCIAIQVCPASNPCKQVCIVEGSSFRCGCINGYYINPLDRISCIDMNQTISTAKPSTNSCGRGYTVDPTSRTGCKDIDECQTQHPCQQKCDNLDGSFRCTCNDKFVVSAENNTRCKELQLCTAAVDVIFAVDSAAGMGNNNYQLLLSFVSEISRHFQIGAKKARFGMIIFGKEVVQVFGLDDHKTDDLLSKAILSAPYLGNGNSVNPEVFDFTRKEDLFQQKLGGRPHVHDEFILFTDSSSSPDTFDITRVAAENLKNMGVTITAVGIGDDVSRRELTSMASTNEHVLLVPDFYHIENIQEKLIRLTCPEIDD